MPEYPVLGWDVGGAHLKAARLDAAGRVERVVQVPCTLWQGLSHLHVAMEAIRAELGTAPLHAVTMTGEMVDLFPDRADGVARLIDAMERGREGATLLYYAGTRGLLDPPSARHDPAAVASANWMASATLVASQQVDALFLDIGSTTTDIVAVRNGRVSASGRDDFTRLISGELVYTGVVRTPLMAMTDRVPFGGDQIPLTAEYFATAADVYRILGTLPEGADQQAAADGGEKTVAASARRLARMIGRDAGSAPMADWRALAVAFADIQQRRIREGCEQVAVRASLPENAPIVAAGVGRYLAAGIAQRTGRRCLDFATLVPHAPSETSRVSDCAPAVAVAWLARQRVG